MSPAVVRCKKTTSKTSKRRLWRKGQSLLETGPASETMPKAPLPFSEVNSHTTTTTLTGLHIFHSPVVSSKQKSAGGYWESILPPDLLQLYNREIRGSNKDGGYNSFLICQKREWNRTTMSPSISSTLLVSQKWHWRNCYGDTVVPITFSFEGARRGLGWQQGKGLNLMS